MVQLVVQGLHAGSPRFICSVQGAIQIDKYNTIQFTTMLYEDIKTKRGKGFHSQKGKQKDPNKKMLNLSLTHILNSNIYNTRVPQSASHQPSNAAAVCYRNSRF